MSVEAVIEVPRPPRWLWIAFVATGVLIAAGGILAIAYPDVTLLVISLILGIELLVFGAVDFVEAFLEEKDLTTRFLEIVLGLIGVIAGVVVLRKPGESLTVIVIVVGLYLLLAGIVQLIRAFTLAVGRGPVAFAGLAMAAVGIVLLAWPNIGLGTVAILAGIGLIVRGLFAIVAGLALRRLAAAGT